MTPQERKVFELALEFIERVNKDGWILADFEDQMYAVMTAINEVLAQPKQEPVAWLSKGGKGIWFHEPDASLNATPLYTTPPPRKPLTDEQIVEHFKENVDTGSLLSFADGVRFAEAAHGIKE